MAERGPTATLIGVAEQHAELVDHRQVGRIRDDDHERLAVAAVRHEAVAQHQVGGDRPEQLLIDPERVHVDELEPVALGEAPRLLELGVVRRRRRDRARGRSAGRRIVGVRGHEFYLPSTELSWKSGMYSASSRPAMTMPMTTSRTGSTSVTNRSIVGRDLLVVEVGDGVQHVLERAGRLADFRHLHGDFREDAARVERRGERLALAHARADDVELRRHVLVADRLAPRCRAR